MKPELSIIIVSYNTREFLRNCLDSIFSNVTDLEFELFVFDNDSVDGSIELVKESYPQVKLIISDKNVGFASANNQVIPMCSGDYILLLNPDTLIVNSCIQILLNFIKDNPHVGAVGPKLIHPATRLRVLSCGLQPTIKSLFNHYTYLSALFPNNSRFEGINLFIGIHDQFPRKVEWFTGACLLVRKETFEQVGLLSEDWFMYAEDMELCDRLRSAGWDIYLVPNAVAEHFLGASSSQDTVVSVMWLKSLRSYYIERNKAGWLKSLGFDVILSFGLLFRTITYRVLHTFKDGGSDLWQQEANRFWKYTLAALPFRSRS